MSLISPVIKLSSQEVLSDADSKTLRHRLVQSVRSQQFGSLAIKAFFSSCSLLSCLSSFTCASLTMAQLFSYILPSSAMSPNDVCCSRCLPGEVSSAAAGAGVCAEGISVCTPLSTHLLLSFGPWRHSWKDSPYSASSLSAMLAHAAANSSLVVFSPIHNIFLVSLFIYHLLSLRFLCFFFFFPPVLNLFSLSLYLQLTEIS